MPRPKAKKENSVKPVQTNKRKIQKTVAALEAPVAAETEKMGRPAYVLPKFSWRTTKWLLLIVAIIGLLTALAFRNKSLFVAAMVNGQPITRWQLNDQLTARYGNQTLDEMIGEKLLREEAAKKGIKVTSAEIEAKQADVMKRVGGQSNLEAALTQQGMTLADFRKQLEIQVLVEKLVADQVKVSDQEVANFIASNSASLTATDEAGQKAEARQILTQQKTSEAFSPWFAALKAKSSVIKFL